MTENSHHKGEIELIQLEKSFGDSVAVNGVSQDSCIVLLLPAWPIRVRENDNS